MDASFTLPYSQFAVADLFIKTFETQNGYSVFAPVSRTEKGIDLVLTRRADAKTHTLTFQIQSSRRYSDAEDKRKKQKRCQHFRWLDRFEVPEQADFVVLFGLYSPDDQSGIGMCKSHVMVFSRADMVTLIGGSQTRGGIGVAFDSADEAYL